MMALQGILDDLAQYLQHSIDEGVIEVEIDPESVGGLDKIRMGGAMRKAPSATVLPRSPAPVSVSVPARAVSPTASPAASASNAAELAEIAKQVVVCTKCPLHKTRTHAVPGQGTSTPEIVFIGEAPGESEDEQGLAFVGRAGQLLTKMIEAMGYTREEVFIGNIIKCRPPENRTPLPDEVETCLPYLKAQLALLKPKVIVALGATAVRGLLNIETGITKLRGKWLSYQGIDLMPTFHPAYLLRNPPAKKEAWDDLKQVLVRVGRTPPPVKK